MSTHCIACNIIRNIVHIHKQDLKMSVYESDPEYYHEPNPYINDALEEYGELDKATDGHNEHQRLYFNHCIQGYATSCKFFYIS